MTSQVSARSDHGRILGLWPPHLSPSQPMRLSSLLAITIATTPLPAIGQAASRIDTSVVIDTQTGRIAAKLWRDGSDWHSEALPEGGPVERRETVIHFDSTGWPTEAALTLWANGDRRTTSVRFVGDSLQSVMGAGVRMQAVKRSAWIVPGWDMFVDAVLIGSAVGRGQLNVERAGGQAVLMRRVDTATVSSVHGPIHATLFELENGSRKQRIWLDESGAFLAGGGTLARRDIEGSAATLLKHPF